MGLPRRDPGHRQFGAWPAGVRPAFGYAAGIGLFLGGGTAFASTVGAPLTLLVWDRMMIR